MHYQWFFFCITLSFSLPLLLFCPSLEQERDFLQVQLNDVSEKFARALGVVRRLHNERDCLQVCQRRHSLRLCLLGFFFCNSYNLCGFFMFFFSIPASAVFHTIHVACLFFWADSCCLGLSFLTLFFRQLSLHSMFTESHKFSSVLPQIYAFLCILLDHIFFWCFFFWIPIFPFFLSITFSCCFPKLSQINRNAPAGASTSCLANRKRYISLVTNEGSL